MEEGITWHCDVFFQIDLMENDVSLLQQLLSLGDKINEVCWGSEQSYALDNLWAIIWTSQKLIQTNASSRGWIEPDLSKIKWAALISIRITNKKTV